MPSDTFRSFSNGFSRRGMLTAAGVSVAGVSIRDLPVRIDKLLGSPAMRMGV